MASKNQLRNLTTSRSRLRRYIKEAISALEKDHPDAIWRFTSRLDVRKSIRAVADEIVSVLERCDIENRHEMHLSTGDMKLRLMIYRDGFIRGYVSCEYDSSLEVRDFLNTLLKKHGLHDTNTSPFFTE